MNTTDSSHIIVCFRRYRAFRFPTVNNLLIALSCLILHVKVKLAIFLVIVFEYIQL